MDQITKDADKEKQQIEIKHESSLEQVRKMGLKSKAELQTTKNKLTETSSEIETLKTLINDKE